MSDALAFAPNEDSLSVVVTQDYTVFVNDKGVPVDPKKGSAEDIARGPLNVLKGEHGWLIQLNGPWALCRFLRGGQSKDLIIATSNIHIGPALKTLTVSVPVVNEDDFAQMQARGEAPWEQFVWHFAIGLGRKRAALRHLGMEPTRVEALFANAATLARNIKDVINCIFLDVRDILSQSMYTISDLLCIRPTTDAADGTGVLYLRLYTHQPTLPGRPKDDPVLGTIEAAAAYSGRTFHILKRDGAHEDGRENNWSSWHYRISRRTKSNDNVFALWVADCSGLSDHQFAFMEELFMQLISSQAPYLLHDTALEAGLEGHRTLLMRDIARAARQASGFNPLRVMGCNATSPLFETTRGRTYTMFTTFATPERAATKILRTATTLCTHGKTKQYKILLAPFLALVIPQKAVHAAGLHDKRAFVTIEVTEDGSRHPYAWYQACEVGLFENNDIVSSLAIRLEYCDAGQNWFSIWLRATGVVGYDAAAGKRPKAWIKAFKMLMLANGWSLDKTSGWFPEAEYPMGELQEVVYNHQTLAVDYRLVSSPKKVTATPKLTTYEANALRAEALFGNEHWGHNPGTIFRAGSKKWSRESCDPCHHALQTKNRKGGSQKGKCEKSEERPNACSKCIVKYNRPCLWLFPEDYEAMPIAQRRRMMDEGEMATFDVVPCHAPYGGEELLDTMDAAQQRLEEEIGRPDFGGEEEEV